MWTFFKIHTQMGKKVECFTHKAREEEGTLNSFAMHEMRIFGGCRAFFDGLVSNPGTSDPSIGKRR